MKKLLLITIVLILLGGCGVLDRHQEWLMKHEQENAGLFDQSEELEVQQTLVSIPIKGGGAVCYGGECKRIRKEFTIAEALQMIIDLEGYQYSLPETKTIKAFLIK